MSEGVDWGLARRIATTVSGGEPPGPAPADLEQRAADARERIVEATGLVPAKDLPPMEWVDRETWIEANLAGMRSMIEPVLEARAAKAPGALQAAGGAVLAVEIGGLLGLFSRRVLGQYEVSLLGGDRAPRLLLVAPNLEHAAREMELDLDALVSWVCIHEVTHAVQFAAVPWLRPHLGDALRELIGGLDVQPDLRSLLRIDLDDVRGIVDAVRRGGLAGAVLGEERRARLEGVQATMTLVEGHAEHVMDHVGRDLLDALPELRAAMDRRRADRAPLLKILDKVLGLELKLRQYQDGKRFCDAVERERGERALLTAWESPEAAPTAAELPDPAAWLARTRPAAA